MDSEPACPLLEVSSIMRHNCVCATVYSSLKNHLVVCVGKLGPPAKINLNRFDECCKFL